jgi:hypothetical protein
MLFVNAIPKLAFKRPATTQYIRRKVFDVI